MPKRSRVIKLKDILELYYVKDDTLMWRVDRAHHPIKDTPAGHLNGIGYLVTNINRKQCMVHRLLYQIYHNLEELPSDKVIDHIDRNRSNNSIDNLQLVDYIQNSHNLTKDYRNTSGYTGVSWSKITNNWQVRIRIKNERFYLGEYADLIQAAEAYDIAALRRDPDNHVLNFPEKKEEYLKYITINGSEIKRLVGKRREIQSGEKYIHYMENKEGNKTWRVVIEKNRIKYAKYFRYTPENLSLAIEWRNATYEMLNGRPYTK